MRFLSVCSGIEAASVAWAPLGWKAVAFSEIEPFPCAVLAHHYPTTPNWGDMTKFEEWPDVSIDLLCGGTPCQSFSVAGLRKGLADPRGNLMLTFGAIAAKYRPQWLVWENVPGVLSSNGGRDFGAFLGMLGQLGYGFAYRVLDAQYFGVAQRRRRVFVVGCLGDWRSAAAVLFERHSLCGHPAPSREARQTTAGSLTASAGRRGGVNDPERGQLIAGTLQANGKAAGSATQQDAESGLLLPVAFGGNRTSSSIDVAPALLAQPGSGYKNDFESETFLLQPAHTQRGEGFDASEDGTGRGTPLIPVAGTLGANHGNIKAEHAWTGQLIPVAFDTTQITSAANRSNQQPGDACHPLAAGAHAPAIEFNWNAQPDQMRFDEHCSATLTRSHESAVAIHENQRAEITLNDTAGAIKCAGGKPGQGYPAVMTAMQVRRLTPTECERLQGFPDGYTAIPWRGKPADQCPDGPRYKALGNSWAVPNVAWIGRRIEAVRAVALEKAA
jgi:DNA (cytosine-5)-methyltransferase 1